MDDCSEIRKVDVRKRKAHRKNNYHENIYRKVTGKLGYGDGNLFEVEMPDQVI